MRLHILINLLLIRSSTARVSGTSILLRWSLQKLTSKHIINICKWLSVASRAAQSNSVYVCMLEISIVHANSASKSLRQKFFFARAAIVSAGKKYYISRQDSAHQSQNEDNCPTFSLRFLNEAEKKKINWKGDPASTPSRFAAKFWQIDTLIKPNKWQTGLF